MDIVIVAQYLRDIENFKENNSRFVYLAKMLSVYQDNKIEIITSDFNHATKRTFSKIGEITGIKVTALHESGYQKNVSLCRFKSHRDLARKVAEYLNGRKKPDVIYCAVPSLDVAEVAANYCEKNAVRFIVDVQDLWPEAFKMVFHIPVVSDLIFSLIKKQANRIYKAADCVVAVSQTYVERVMEVNQKCKQPIVVYLGTEKESFDKYADCVVGENKEITIVYVGSMSTSYDLDLVIEAIAQINEEVPTKLLAMGEGSLKGSFIKHAKAVGIKAEFTGRLPYPQMVEYLMSCDIAVNPIHKGSAGSIINKVGDYAMAGLPVVNTQECNEYKNLLVKYNAGINCECESISEVANALRILSKNANLRKEMAANSRKLGEDFFDRKSAYQRIVVDLLRNPEGY